MAGHSQFKNIMHRKGAQDIKRAKIFAKISREIMVAVKTGGPDHTSNPRLRAALALARGANMPKDNIDRAIKKVLGGEDQANFEEIRYEGYGPGGVAVIVEALTDNRNRTASEVRSYFTKYNGSLGETNSVSFMFERIGVIHYEASKGFDTLFESAVDAGADNVEDIDGTLEVTCGWESFGSVRDHLITHMGDPMEAKIMWRALNTTSLNTDQAKSFLKMMDVLEDNDDVQHVYSNADIHDDILATL
jgi:YebC/PmpR family DNA-binding regulatory protein